MKQLRKALPAIILLGLWILASSLASNEEYEADGCTHRYCD